MAIPRSSWLGACLLPILWTPAAWGTTNTNFNFEADDGGWTVQTTGLVEQPWTYVDSGSDKGWQAFRGDDAAGSGSFLVSPLLFLDPPSGTPGQYVAVKIKHLFDFGGVSSPRSLGQVQYRYAGGDWEGVPTAAFLPASAEHYPPDFPSPPAPFISSTDVPDPSTPVQAWAGATAGFPGTHRDSEFRLEYPPLGDYPFVPGETFQLRLLAGTLDPLAAGDPDMIWDVTAVEVKHAGVVPEPAGIALAAGGLAIGALLVASRARRRAAVGLVVVGTLALLAASPSAQAMPIDVEYDFATGPSGWASLNTSADGFSYPRQWTWGGGTWNVRPTPVLASAFWVANNLTSPRILVDPLTDALQVTVVHRYTFPTGYLTGKPLVAGQLVYRLGDSINPFLPLVPSEFATGPIDPAFQSKTPYPTWVPPGGVASVSRDPPLVASGGIWQGTSPGFGSNQFVASRVLLENLVPGQEIEFGFINANLGFNCTGGLWEIAFVDIQGLLVPEPASLALTAVGGLAAAGAIRRRGVARRADPAARRRLTISPPRRA